MGEIGEHHCSGAARGWSQNGRRGRRQTVHLTFCLVWLVSPDLEGLGVSGSLRMKSMNRGRRVSWKMSH